MSEADNVWRVIAGGLEHEIELDHSTMTGKVVVKLDGVEVGEDRMLARRKQVEFSINGVPALAELSFAYGGFGARSELHVDGKYVAPLSR